MSSGCCAARLRTSFVRQEVDGLMLAYYAVRRLIYAAACQADEDPDRLSFVHAVRVIRRRIQNAGASPRRTTVTGSPGRYWTRFSKSGWSPVAGSRNPAASNAR